MTLQYHISAYHGIRAIVGSQGAGDPRYKLHRVSVREVESGNNGVNWVMNMSQTRPMSSGVFKVLGEVLRIQGNKN